jgi:hypothetical protein
MYGILIYKVFNTISRMKWIKYIFLFAFMVLSLSKKSTSQPMDWRNIRNGHVIPDLTYSDQPYIIKTKDGAWLCILTTGTGKEGDSGQVVATTRSTDRGRTWSELVFLEPRDGPEASYAVMLEVPSGRIYAFYNHNTDNLREIFTIDSATIKRVDSQGYYVFKYSDDYGKSWSDERYTIPVREFRIDRENIYGGKVRFFWNVGKAFIADSSGYIPLIKVGGFGKGFFTSNEGVLLKSANILYEEDPQKIIWETLPEGNTGLRTPPGGGPISAEQSYTVLKDGSFYCIYRTIDGHPVYTYSRDGGHTWDEPKYLRYDNGRLVKHPRAANFVWRCANGKYLYWFHNHGGRYIREHSAIAYEDRNPAWIAGGIETDGTDGKVIRWTQPEIVLYDDDPIIRMSYPDLIEDDGKYFISETQKDIARVHEIDKDLLESLWRQFDNREKTLDQLAGTWTFDSPTFPVQIHAGQLKPFYQRDNQRADHGGISVRGGFTIDIAFKLDELSAGQVLLSNVNEWGKGIQMTTTANSTLRLILSDGRTVSSWDCDRGLIQPGKMHYLSVVVDGGPKIIMFITDGHLNDGGDDRQFGWGRFNPYLQDINGSEQWIVGEKLKGTITYLGVYNRAIRVSEAIGNFNNFTGK